MSVERTISLRYVDPLDALWLRTAERLGMRVKRAPSAYASWDGHGTLTIAPPEELDPDDCLAQMVLHEICHALVAGPQALHLVDWGLDNTSDAHVVQEHATNRLQASLTAGYGLRQVLAPTTDFRVYYDALPQDPLAPGDDPAIPVARAAHERARTGSWARRLESALLGTYRIVRELHCIVASDSLFAAFEPLHKTGLAASSTAGKCGACAWFVAPPDSGPGQCRQARHARVDGSAQVLTADDGCALWEIPLSIDDCGACGACCRAGFDWVEVPGDDPVRQRHPGLLEHEGDVWFIPRPNGMCRALSVEPTSGHYRCSIYADRPRPCAEFEVAGEACLDARRRVGLSR